MASPSILTAQGYTPMIFFGNNDGEVHALYPDGIYMLMGGQYFSRIHYFITCIF